MTHRTPRAAVAAFSTLILLAALAGFALAQGKVGYIDLQRLIDESTMGVSAKQDIERLLEQKDLVVQRSLEQIESMKRRLAEASLDPDQRRALEDDLHQRYERHKRLVSDSKEQMQREEMQLVSFVLKKAEAVLERIAKKEGYSMILKDPNAIGYMDPKLDITDKVIQQLNWKQP